ARLPASRSRARTRGRHRRPPFRGARGARFPPHTGNASYVGRGGVPSPYRGIWYAVGPTRWQNLGGSSQPHTSAAVSTTSSSFFTCSAIVRRLPSTVEENPHWGDRHSWS